MSITFKEFKTQKRNPKNMYFISSLILDHLKSLPNAPKLHNGVLGFYLSNPFVKVRF